MTEGSYTSFSPEEWQVELLGKWLKKTFGPGEDELVAASQGTRDPMSDEDWRELARLAFKALEQSGV